MAVEDPSEQPEIRSVTLYDADLLAEIHGCCFPNEPWSPSAITEILAMPSTFGALALSANEPVGLVLARGVLEDCEILTLAVLPQCRRRGHGKGLLNWTLAEAGARKHETLHLEVAADNAPATRLYRSKGFSSVGERPEYYKRQDGSKISAILYSRQI